MSDQIVNQGDVVTAFLYRRGKARAECSCGWSGWYRMRRAAAVLDALRHSADTRCLMNTPLVSDVRGPGWIRRTFGSPVAIAAMPLLLIPAGLGFAPDAHALRQPARITVTVVWTGTPDCIRAWVPEGTGTAPVALCSLHKMWSASYPAPDSPRWIGVDPMMSGAETLSCSMSATFGHLASDFGVRGDGDDVTCLRKWVA